MRKGKQPRVPPESTSWFVSGVTATAWADKGNVIGKAHRVKESNEARCGAPIYVPIEQAEAGFPACRNCWKLEGAPVPFAFYEAQATQGGRA